MIFRLNNDKTNHYLFALTIKLYLDILTMYWVRLYANSYFQEHLL